MPKKDHYVIIGNGPAGNSAADTLRAADGKVRITIISDEMISFYYRHRLPEFLAGKIKKEALTVRPYTVYRESNIRLRLGQTVERIEPLERTLYLKHMEMVRYTKLLIAVGACATVPNYLDSFGEHLTRIGSYSDVLRMQPALDSSKRILVLGGDLVSFKVARCFLDLGKEISFIIYPDCFWPFTLTKAMSKQLKSQIEKNGVPCHIGDEVTSIERRSGKLQVKTEGGLGFKVDMVACFMGYKPKIQFILGSGIDTERGVLVDDYLRTNLKDVYACGDCAQIYNPELKNYWTSIGWQNAEVQGRLAAQNMLGGSTTVKPAKKKVLEVEGVKVNTSWWKKF